MQDNIAGALALVYLILMPLFIFLGPIVLDTFGKWPRDKVNRIQLVALCCILWPILFVGLVCVSVWVVMKDLYLD